MLDFGLAPTTPSKLATCESIRPMQAISSAKLQVLRKGYMVQTQRNYTKIRNQQIVAQPPAQEPKEQTAFSSLMQSRQFTARNPVRNNYLRTSLNQSSGKKFMLTIEEARQRESLKGFKFPPQHPVQPPVVLRKKSTIKCNLIQSLNLPSQRNRADTIDTVHGSRNQALPANKSDRASIHVNQHRASRDNSHASLNLSNDGSLTHEVESNCPSALENINLQSKYNPGP